jgi:hypothetical protein
VYVGCETQIPIGRGSPTSRLCIVPVESTIGSQSVACEYHEHNIGLSSWPKIECEGTQNNVSVFRPNSPIIMYSGFELKFTASCMFSKCESKRVHWLQKQNQDE